MKKLILIALTPLLLFSGCSVKEGPLPTPSNVDQTLTQTDTKPEPEFNITGEIMSFDEENVHIRSGDIITPYKINKDQRSQFYIGQSVTLLESTDGVYELQAAEVNPNDAKFTTMGEKIETFTGTVESFKDKLLTVKSEEMTLTFEVNEEKTFEAGRTVEISYFGSAENPYVYLSAIILDNKVDLTIETLSRTEEGYLFLNLLDETNGAYAMTLSGQKALFNLSALKIGDTLTVYHDGIMESNPMQINPLRVVLKSQK